MPQANRNHSDNQSLTSPRVGFSMDLYILLATKIALSIEARFTGASSKRDSLNLYLYPAHETGSAMEIKFSHLCRILCIHELLQHHSLDMILLHP